MCAWETAHLLARCGCTTRHNSEVTGSHVQQRRRPLTCNPQTSEGRCTAVRYGKIKFTDARLRRRIPIVRPACLPLPVALPCVPDYSPRGDLGCCCGGRGGRRRAARKDVHRCQGRAGVLRQQVNGYGLRARGRGGRSRGEVLLLSTYRGCSHHMRHMNESKGQVVSDCRANLPPAEGPGSSLSMCCFTFAPVHVVL